MSDGDLQKRLEQLGRTLVEDIETWEHATRDKRRHAMERLTETVSRKIEQALDKQKARDLRRQAKADRRAERRRQRREEASVVAGVVYLLIAAACVAYAALRPDFFWLLFVALGMGLSGARQFRDVAARKRSGAPPVEREGAPALPSPVAAPVKPHEIDVLCDQLLADLKGSPEAVRAFLNDPEKTVETMRTTARSLDARRQQLLAEADAARTAAVEKQRAELARKRDGLQDAEARRRLDGALNSLDAQLAALAQLRGAAERIDGEYTSLLVLLQELRTRVAVAKTAGTTPQFEGLQQNVRRLNDELEAITSALADAQRESLPAVVAISSDEVDAPAAERERA